MADYVGLEDATGHVLLEDGTSGLLLETSAVPVSATRTLSYSISSRVAATRSLLYTIGRVSSTRTVFYTVSQPVASSMHLAYSIAGRTTATRTVRYHIVGVGRVASTHTFVYDIGDVTEIAGRFCIAFNASALEWDEAIFTRLDDPDMFPGLVTSYSIDRGRQYELDKTDTGRATVSIADQHGILNPRNPDGPFYGQLRPLLQACINRYNPTTGTWRTRFRGYIEDMSYEFDPSQRVNRLQVSLVDQFEILSAIQMQPGRFGSGTNTDGQIIFQRAGVQDRIVHILDDAGFQPHSRVIFSGNVILQKQPYSAGESPMTVIQESADGEFPGVSNVYCDRKGRLCFHGRFAKFDPEQVAAGASVGAWDFHRWNVGDGAAAAAAIAGTAQVRQFGFVRGLSKVINQALATPNNMDDIHLPEQLVEDLASTGVYGIRSWSATNLVTHQSVIDGSDRRTETRRFATYYVENYSEPRDRVERVVLRSLMPDDPRAPALWAVLCQVDVSDGIEITVASPGGGGFETESYFVEGVHEETRPLGDDHVDDVTVTLDLSPAAYFASNPFPTTSSAGDYPATPPSGLPEPGAPLTATGLAVASGMGDTNIKVDGVTGFTAGSHVVVDSGTRGNELVVIASVGTAGSGGTGITLTTSLARAHGLHAVVMQVVVNPDDQGMIDQPFLSGGGSFTVKPGTWTTIPFTTGLMERDCNLTGMGTKAVEIDVGGSLDPGWLNPATPHVITIPHDMYYFAGNEPVNWWQVCLQVEGPMFEGLDSTRGLRIFETTHQKPLVLAYGEDRALSCREHGAIDVVRDATKWSGGYYGPEDEVYANGDTGGFDNGNHERVFIVPNSGAAFYHPGFTWLPLSVPSDPASPRLLSAGMKLVAQVWHDASKPLVFNCGSISGMAGANYNYRPHFVICQQAYRSWGSPWSDWPDYWGGS